MSTGGAAAGPRRQLVDACADIAVDEGRDLRDRDADEHDRLMVLDQLRTGDLPLRRHAGQDADRLARIAAAPTKSLLSQTQPLSWSPAMAATTGGSPSDFAEAVGTWHELGRLGLAQELLQPRFGRCRAHVADGQRQQQPVAVTSNVLRRTGHGRRCPSWLLPTSLSMASPGIPPARSPVERVSYMCSPPHPCARSISICARARLS